MNQIRPILLLLLLFSFGCKKDELNPCLSKQTVSADFTMEQEIGWYLGGTATRFSVDTIGTWTPPVIFTARQDMDSFVWTVGTDKRVWRKKSFSLDFDTYTGPVSIQLIGYRKPATNCFPYDDGVDTVRKTLYVIPKQNLPVFGAWKGKLDGYPDSSVIIYSTWRKGIKGLECNDIDTAYAYSDMEVSTYDFYVGSNYCNAPHGFGHVDRTTRDLTIEYVTWDKFHTKSTNFSFKGQRLK